MKFSVFITLLATLVVVTFGFDGCRNLLNRSYERRCPDEATAAGLPFKISKINGWSECYLRCPESWVPAEGFHGCHR